MKENYNEVKESLYRGMSIFNILKDVGVVMNGKEVLTEDKKYLSLYLGIINSDNKISIYLKEKNIKFGFPKTIRDLTQEQYLEIYNKYFIDILNEINFESIEYNFNYLLSKKVVRDFNRSNGYYANKTINDRNKEFIKTIK